MTKLTNRQNEILEYIKKYIVSNGYPPTVREIAKAMGVSSPATIHAHLENLEEKGVIKKESTKNRAIELLVENEYIDNNEEVSKVPLLGKITAGSPIEAIENPDEYFTLPSYLIPNNKEVFTLLVDGESMINAGIYDGDIVIVERTKEARNGNIVVAMTEDSEVTLKTFYKEKNHIRLQPENDYMEPIILSNISILGRAIGLYRKL
ncbi:MAG TPA: transcriptional repressor LexA [Mollicutes bacterium]|jgi:repressor LexA|nr:transcriptional repressor LexA [Mollicutes bacterium]